MGDPGFLAERLLDKRPLKKHTVGIVPRFSDRMDTSSRILENSHGKRIKIVDVADSPGSVINAIASCDYILSSSPHGLIVADALGVPNGRIRLLSELAGGDFKLKIIAPPFPPK